MQQQVLIKTRQMQRLEHEIGEPIEDFIRHRYEAGAGQQEIADALRLTIGTVSRWMRELGIEARASGPRRAET